MNEKDEETVQCMTISIVKTKLEEGQGGRQAGKLAN